jgi:hypothetical protein
MKTYLVKQRYDASAHYRHKTDPSGGLRHYGLEIAVDADSPEEAVELVLGSFEDRPGEYVVTEAAEVIVSLRVKEFKSE